MKKTLKSTIVIVAMLSICTQLAAVCNNRITSVEACDTGCIEQEPTHPLCKRIEYTGPALNWTFGEGNDYEVLDNYVPWSCVTTVYAEDSLLNICLTMFEGIQDTDSGLCNDASYEGCTGS
jgi:hypothetical protein